MQHLEPYSMVFMEMNRKINRFIQIVIAQHISSLCGQKYLNNGVLTVRLLKLPAVLGKLGGSLSFGVGIESDSSRKFSHFQY